VSDTNKLPFILLFDPRLFLDNVKYLGIKKKGIGMVDLKNRNND
jgi:hypothetical protein